MEMHAMTVFDMIQSYSEHEAKLLFKKISVIYLLTGFAE